MTCSTSTLTRFAWLSILAAIITIGLKLSAYFITGSVSLLSDALESLVNLVAAIVALLMLIVAARPPDEEHAYGHSKAEYFSSGVEGTLILIAAVSIVYTALPRLFLPQPITQISFGLSISLIASLINFIVARILFKAGRHYRSITLEADAQHLMTDVWTSIGVLLGIGAVMLTGWELLDPIMALIVALHIIWSGVRLLQRSVLGLLDTAIPQQELVKVHKILTHYQQNEGIRYHALRTRQAGVRRFVSVHILVPGIWTVHSGHQMLERIECDIRRTLPQTTVFTHLEPMEDPNSWEDMHLDRLEQQSIQHNH